MNKQLLSILQVSTCDSLGGAEKIAVSLFLAYRSLGHRSWLTVGHKTHNDSDIFIVPNHSNRSIMAKFTAAVGHRIWPYIRRVRGMTRFRHLIEAVGDPGRLRDLLSGREDMNFPGTWKILDTLPASPNIVHCHNLHGYYFDLKALPFLNQRAPIVLTLHDAWLLSGHCAHSFECERWKDGCGRCPDLNIYPAVLRDSTAYNWQIKKDIFSKCKFYVATPSQWLMKKVSESMLAPTIIESRVIPNGVDLSTFHSFDKKQARLELGIPQGAKVLVFAATNVRKNIWKDYKTVVTAVQLIAERANTPVHLFAIGGTAGVERIGKATLTFIPHQRSMQLARYYQAADLYLHAARAETWGLTVTESLACGTPVVATAVGGITEQIDNGETGFLVEPGDPEAMADRVLLLLSNDTLRRKFGEQAAISAKQRFDSRVQADRYLEWYEEIHHSVAATT